MSGDCIRRTTLDKRPTIWGRVMIEQRRYPRFHVRVPIVFSGDHPRGYGRLLNLSMGGCAVESDAYVTTATELRLLLSLHDPGDPLEVELAPVRWSRTGRFGVEFGRMQPEAQERLRQFVSRL